MSLPKVVLTPLAGRVLETLYRLPQYDLKYRPIAAVAERLGVKPQSLNRPIKQLIQSKLIERTGREIVMTLQNVRSRMKLSTIASSSFTKSQNQQQNPGIRCRPNEAFHRGLYISYNNSYTASSFSYLNKGDQKLHFKTASEPHKQGFRKTLAEKEHEGMKSFIPNIQKDTRMKDLDQLRKFIDIRFQKKSRWGAKSEEVQRLAAMWLEKRRIADPLRDIHPSETKAIARAAKRLKDMMIPVNEWPGYVDYVFRVFPRFAKCTMPPAKVLSSQNLIEQYRDRYLSALRINGRRAAEMLMDAGYDPVRVNFDIVIDLAIEMRTRGKISAAVPDKYLKPVKWLSERLVEVGFAEC